ncbi:extracellular solute-binding protein [Sulfurovum sp.]|uniref:extracellular solute-binding protein n=1 Tax=Sulfurovum sp. TaxID=1969726 RepID=UPI0025E56107|nr:extracellular solute-binding protein [Sulfurovum sp.]
MRNLLIILPIAFLTISCTNNKPQNEVVIYTSVDQIFSSTILKAFEKETGIRVKAVYDTEASKAVGLEKRLLAEKKHPQADLFWNSENLRTARLDEHGIFREQPKKIELYEQTNTPYFSDRKSWYGMGIRSRVFIVNTDLLSEEEYPTKLEDLTDPKFRGKVAICNPLVGTASAQFASLYAKWGETRFIDFLKALKANKVAILAGNSTVKSAVGNGEYPFGLVDTDDALVGIEQGLPLKMLYYDQESDGVFAFYQTLGILKKGPNPITAQILFDYLFNASTEDTLITMNAVQFPVLSKNALHKKPIMWSLPPAKTESSLKPSAQLIRKYLDR